MTISWHEKHLSFSFGEKPKWLQQISKNTSAHNTNGAGSIEKRKESEIAQNLNQNEKCVAKIHVPFKAAFKK